MKKIINKIGLYLLCALCVICFASCAQPNSTDGASSQNTATDSMQGDNSSQDSSDDSKEDSSSQDLSASDSSDDSKEDSTLQDSSDDSKEDDNELPRVPYGAE